MAASLTQERHEQAWIAREAMRREGDIFQAPKRTLAPEPQHDARAFRWHEGRSYAACSCGWRTTTHYDGARAADDAERHNRERAST